MKITVRCGVCGERSSVDLYDDGTLPAEIAGDRLNEHEDRGNNDSIQAARDWGSL
jgi:hypothetical protein